MSLHNQHHSDNRLDILFTLEGAAHHHAPRVSLLLVLVLTVCRKHANVNIFC